MEGAAAIPLCVRSGALVQALANAKYVLNENIVYDPESDTQRIARSGFSETKLLPSHGGASLSVFSNSNKVYWSWM